MRNIIIGPVTPVIDLLDEFENKSTCNRIVTQQIGDPTGFHMKIVKRKEKERTKTLELDFFERNSNDEFNP